MPNPLTRKKSLASLLSQAGDSNHSLKRTLNARHLVALGIGAIIGAGLFVRTAAASAMAARALARKGSRVMAIIGNGAQSEFQALAFAEVLGIEEFRLFDVDRAATAKLAANLATQGLRATAHQSAAEAVLGADIVTTITADKTNATIVTADMIAPGTHINAVGGDCPGKTELHADVLASARVFVEYEPQTRIEGDIQQMPADFAVTELWRVLAGSAPGRNSDAEITVFDSVGFAVEDYSALRYLLALAEAAGFGQTLPLIADQDDPKNLFALLAAPGTKHVAGAQQSVPDVALA